MCLFILRYDAARRRRTSIRSRHNPSPICSYFRSWSAAAGSRTSKAGSRRCVRRNRFSTKCSSCRNIGEKVRNRCLHDISRIGANLRIDKTFQIVPCPAAVVEVRRILRRDIRIIEYLFVGFPGHEPFGRTEHMEPYCNRRRSIDCCIEYRTEYPDRDCKRPYDPFLSPRSKRGAERPPRPDSGARR